MSYFDSQASAHFNEIHEKIHRWGIKTHLEDEDEDVVPLIGGEEDEEEVRSLALCSCRSSYLH